NATTSSCGGSGRGQNHHARSASGAAKTTAVTAMRPGVQGRAFLADRLSSRAMSSTFSLGTGTCGFGSGFGPEDSWYSMTAASGGDGAFAAAGGGLRTL